jgi:hypothetical protein
MKEIVLKVFVILPIIVFVDYFIMIVVGCISSCFGFNANFYECTFCTIGKVVMTISLMVFLYIVTLDFINHYKHKNQVC